MIRSVSRDYLPYPMVGVGVVVWRGDEVLLIRRGKPPRIGEYSLPGGRQELGETLREAAQREVMEETGVTIAVTHLIDVIDHVRRDPDGRVRQHYSLIDFGAEWQSGDARPGDDAMAVQWVPLARIEGLGLWSETVRVIKLSAEKR